MSSCFFVFENKRFRNPDILYPYLKEQIKDDDIYYILLDEVQLLGEFESVLNGLIRIKNVDVYVTGAVTKEKSRPQWYRRLPEHDFNSEKTGYFTEIFTE